MADLVADRSHDPAVRLMAFDIASTQNNQVGRMQGWLALWGLPLSGGDADGLDGRHDAGHGRHAMAGGRCGRHARDGDRGRARPAARRCRARLRRRSSCG